MGEPSSLPVLPYTGKLCPDSVSKVFEIDHIREQILEYATQHKYQFVKSNVSSCRLVNKTWLQSTLRTLRRSGQTLFQFHLYRCGFVVGNDWTSLNTGKIGDFLQSLQGEDSGVAKHVPSHCMQVRADYFYQEKNQDFLDYLVSCGSSLTALTILFTISTYANDMIPPLNVTFLLPQLQHFTVELLPRVCDCQNVNVVQQRFDLIQKILEGCQQLKTFAVNCDAEDNLSPVGFGNTRLPSSLRYIELACKLSDNSLEMLVNSPLHKLQELKLCVHDTPFRDGLITSILQNVGKSLRVCNFTEGIETSANRGTTFQLPLMEKLQELKIKTMYLELVGNLSCLQKRVPALKHFTMASQTRQIRKWTDQSCFPSVNTLSVTFVGSDHFNDEDATSHGRNFVSLNLSAMESLTCAFPNLHALSMKFHVSGTELSALVPVLEKMRTLGRLRLLVEDDGHLVNCDAWDALLLGVPLESVAELKESPASLEELQAENGVSIRNLSALHTLELESISLHEFPMISDAVFHFAFFKMPKLTTLTLTGGFYTTDQIKEMWEKEGRKIIQRETRYYGGDFEDDGEDRWSDFGDDEDSGPD